MKKNGLWYVI